MWLLNTRLVYHRIALICDLIAGKRADLAWITKTRFGPEEEGTPFGNVPNWVWGVASVMDLRQG